MSSIISIKPAEAFQYLHDNNLPLILSFHLEEERGHLITGKGLCYVEAMYGSSRVKLGRFSPYRSLHAVRNSGSFYVHFESKGESYGCIVENITPDSTAVVDNIPQTLFSFLRKFVRVESSKKAPVLLYVRSRQQGTISYWVRDISEQGLGLFLEAPPDMGDNSVCGIEMPLDGGTLVL